MYKKVKKILLYIYFLFFVFQLFILPTFENIVSCIISWSGFMIGINSVLDEKKILKAPLSSFVLFYYILAWHLFPIISTTLEFKPIISNLNLSIESFLNLFFVLIIMILSFNVYVKRLSKKTFSFIKYKYSESEIWILGVVGIMCFIVSWVFGAKNINKINSSILFAITDAFSILMYAPFVLLLSKMVYIKSSIRKKYVLLLYAIIFIFLAMISNRRATIASVFLIPLYILLFSLYIQRYDYRIFLKQKYFLLLFIFIPLFSLVSDFGYALLAVRGMRSNVEPIEMIDETIDAMQDSERLQEIKNRFVFDEENIKKSDKLWDEYYVDNMFFSRQGNVKYVDLSLIYSNKLKGNEMFELYISTIICLLPQVVIDYVGYDVNKNEIILSSMADYMVYYADNNKYSLFCKKLGNICGLGWACFGVFFPIVLFVILFPVYRILDIFIVYEKGVPYISLFGALSIQKLISYFAFHEGVSTYTHFIFRMFFDMLVVIISMYILANIYSRLRKVCL